MQELRIPWDRYILVGIPEKLPSISLKQKKYEILFLGKRVPYMPVAVIILRTYTVRLVSMIARNYYIVNRRLYVRNYSQEHTPIMPKLVITFQMY